MGLGDQATIKNTEFYIELGRSCNLNCGHCLNRSGNNIPIVELTDSELDLLSHTVNSSANIQTVHFSGGEPTLYKNSILNLQKLIVRKISYSITTNGSIGYDFTDWLENVKIDLIYLSIDKWHSPWVDRNILIKFIMIAKDKMIPLEVHSVIDDLTDLAELKWCSDLNLKIQPHFRIKSGKSRSSSQMKNLDSNESCPSLTKQLLKVNWYKNMGYSICCGPLYFDKLVDDSFLLSPNLIAVANSPITLFHEKQNLKQVLTQFKFYHANFKSPCEACVFLFKQRKSLGNLSYYNILNSDYKYFPIQNIVSDNDWHDLANDYALKYVVTKSDTRELASFKHEEYNSIRSNISKAPFNKSDKSELLQFVKVNYFDRWRDFVNDTDFQILSNKTDDYLKKDIKGIWYIKDNIPVGLLIYSYDTNHTVFNCPTIHIGHWGYQKDLVTSLEAKFIKNDWLYELQKIAIKHDFPPLTAIISDFNNSSLNFAIKNNFNITHFRLDSRNLE